MEELIKQLNFILPGEPLNEAQKNVLYRMQLETGILIPPSDHNSVAYNYLASQPNPKSIKKQLSGIPPVQLDILAIQTVKYYQLQDKMMPPNFQDYSFHEYLEMESFSKELFVERINYLLSSPYISQWSKHNLKQQLLDYSRLTIGQWITKDIINQFRNRNLRIMWYAINNIYPNDVNDFMAFIEVLDFPFQSKLIGSELYLGMIQRVNNRAFRNFLIQHKSKLGSKFVNGLLRKKPIKTCNPKESKKDNLTYIQTIKKINSLQSHWNLNQNQLPNLYEIHSKNTAFVDKNKIASISGGSDLVIAYLKGALKSNIINQKLGGYGLRFIGDIYKLVNPALPMDLTYGYNSFPRGTVVYKGLDIIKDKITNGHLVFQEYGSHVKYGRWHNPYKEGVLKKGILYSLHYQVAGILLENGNYIHLDSLPISESLIEDPNYFDTLYNILYNKYKDYLKLSDLEDKNAKYEVDLGTMNLKEFFVELLTYHL